MSTEQLGSGVDRCWRERAACVGVDPELFFPTAESGPARQEQVAAAKAVCAGCPVRAECLAEALARLPYGIAGGLTEQERRRLRAGRPTSAGGLSAQAREVLTDGPARGMGQRERAGIGRELLADGRAPHEVAVACRVSGRTAERWATTDDRAGEGSRGGNRAPLRTSHPHNPLAGTRAAEGSRG